jgi:hypothetical protein
VRTFEFLEGCPELIVHASNATSPRSKSVCRSLSAGSSPRCVIANSSRSQN